MYLSRSLYVCPSVSLSFFSPHISLSLSYSFRLWLSCSVYLFISPSAGSSLSLLLIPSLLHCSLSPTSPLLCSTVLHLFISLCTSLRLLFPTEAVCLWLSISLRDSYFASCFLSFVPLSLCILLSVSLSLCLQIFMERFSHMLDIDLRPQPDPCGH